MKNKIIISLLVVAIIIASIIFVVTLINYYNANIDLGEPIDIENNNSNSTLSDNSTIITVDEDSSIRIINEYDENMFKGHKSVIFFWASWCSHCSEEYPVVKQVITDYQNKGYNIYVISHDYKVDELADFMKNNDFNYEVYFDEQRIIRKNINPEASSVPLTYILDENVNLIYAHSGEITIEEFDRIIDEYIN